MYEAISETARWPPHPRGRPNALNYATCCRDRENISGTP